MHQHDVLFAVQASHTCARADGGALFAQFSRADFQANNGRQYGIRRFSAAASENHAPSRERERAM